MPTKNPGDVLTSTLWNSYLRDNIDKLLTRGHRVLTVAQFGALTGLEGTKGTVAPDEVYLEVDSANGIQWHFAYESGETTYKWRFLGGPPMTSLVATSESTSSATDVDLATVGPSITIPRGGDYDLDFGATISGSNSSNAQVSLYANAGLIFATLANQTAIAGALFACWRAVRAVGRATSDVMKLKYLSTAGASATFANRTLRLWPVRIV